MIQYTPAQNSLIEAQLTSSAGLTGPAGSGKTTVGLERLKFLAQQGVPGREILVFFPQRNLGKPYQDLVTSLDFTGCSLPVTATYGGLARRSIELFWPLILDQLGLFSRNLPPVFLTLETTLYFLARIVDPLLKSEGLFASVTIQKNRLLSQVLDNLNKAAVHGFPHTEIAARLQSSWIGDPAQANIFADSQLAASQFRDYCLENNLLDYSLQVEIFSRLVAEVPLVEEYYHRQFSHLIYDNAEEDVPVAHDFILALLPDLESSLIISDSSAGYRHFLGAAPSSAQRLFQECQQVFSFRDVFTAPPQLLSFGESIQYSLGQIASRPELPSSTADYISLHHAPYLPQMLSWVADQIQSALADGTLPGEIVIIAPYLSDSLRFLLSAELELRGVKVTTHRPSRALRAEPATGCLLTLASLAYPTWDFQPSQQDLVSCLIQALGDFDPIRANILARQIRQELLRSGQLIDFESVPGDLQDRITYFAGSKFQRLKDWITEQQANQGQHLDHFLVRLFGEILSQPGFGFHDDDARAEVTERVIDSVKKFRQSAGLTLGFSASELGAEYMKMVAAGILANQYLPSWTQRPSDAVYLAPAYTFLLSNTPVSIQFWLDVGSRGWYERIYQPLTNPYVLHRDWQQESVWDDSLEYTRNLANLANLVNGLIRRCTGRIIFCYTDTDDMGYEQKGLLIQAINKSFRLL